MEISEDIINIKNVIYKALNTQTNIDRIHSHTYTHTHTRICVPICVCAMRSIIITQCALYTSVLCTLYNCILYTVHTIVCTYSCIPTVVGNRRTTTHTTTHRHAPTCTQYT